MKLLTSQSKEAYEILQRDGVFRNTKPDGAEIWEEIFDRAWPWLKDQMTQRVGLPPSGQKDIFPLWAWKSFEDIRDWKRLYRNSRFFEKNVEDNVFIIFTLPDSEILLSRYDLWTGHCLAPDPIYLCSDNEMQEIMANRPAGMSYSKYHHLVSSHVYGLDENYTSVFSIEEIMESWENIFDLQHNDYGFYLNRDPDDPYYEIQANFWELRLSDVVEVFTFDDFPIETVLNSNGVACIDGAPHCCWQCTELCWEKSGADGMEAPVCGLGNFLPTKQGKCKRFEKSIFNLVMEPDNPKWLPDTAR